MLPRRGSTALLALALAALSACASSAPSSPSEPAPTSGAPMSAQEASWQLGWAALAGVADENAAVSPSSFALTLAMLSQGASGQTMEQLDELFGSELSQRGPAFAELRGELERYDSLPASVDAEDPPAEPVVHQASQVVITEDEGVAESFLDAVSEHYGAAVRNVPVDELKAVLDEWVQTHTAGLIEASAIDPTPDMVLVVQDALLFAAKWHVEFTSNTQPLTFTAPSGAQDIEALWGAFEVAHADTDRFEAVRLPYDGTLAMDLVLPASGVDLSAADLADARAALDAAAPSTVEVTVPPLDLTTQVDLLRTMNDLGVELSGGFDGIYPGADVGAFQQQVRLEVTAKGTVGAAVTEVAMVTSAPAGPVEQPIEFVADRPFHLSVLDTSSGWPLFLARVSDAAAAR